MSESVPEQPREGAFIQRQDAESQSIPESLDGQLAAKIIFTSFRLSQGNPGVGSIGNVNLSESNFQNNMFKYLHAAYPSWKIDDADQVTELATSRIMGMFHPGGPDKKGHYIRRLMDNFRSGSSDKKGYYPRRTASGIHAKIPTRQIESSLKNTVNAFQSVLNAPPDSTETQEQITPVLVDNFVSADEVYLLQQKGRKRANPDSSKFITDPYSSSTIEYVLRGRNTGVVEFDDMCGALRKYILQQIADRRTEWTTGSKLDAVISKYNDHHSPEQQYSLPSPEEAVKQIT